MFKLRKKAKDDNDNPFAGYVADGLATADFKAEADADDSTATQNEPTPEIEKLNDNVQQTEPEEKPTGTSAPTPAPAPIPEPKPVEQPTQSTPQKFTSVDPVNPTSDQVDTAIKEAEAETELPADELLENGTVSGQIDAPTQPITTEQVEEVVQEAPTPESESPEPVGQTVPVLSTDEERAAIVAAHKELAELLGWAERDTNGHLIEIQFVIDDLNSKIDHLRTSFAQDTARLNEDAKIAFKENIEKNIALLKEQINRELAKRDVLLKQKEDFIDKIHEALKKYHDSRR